VINRYAPVRGRLSCQKDLFTHNRFPFVSALI
jgi:hypothetical protein